MTSSDKASLPPRIALCLGPHRSGTSLITAAIQAVGAELALPDDFINDENPKGFFEHSGFVELDDQLLALIGSAWDDPSFDSARLAAIDPSELAALKVRAADLIAQDMRPHPLSAVKDPRMSRLLPFWQPILLEQGYDKDDIRQILITRDPVEVALSQRTRAQKNPEFYNFGQSIAEGMALWLSHIRQAIMDIIDAPVLVLSYSDFLSRTSELIQTIAKFVGTEPDAEVVQKFSEEFIDDKLRRSRTDAAATKEAEEAFPGLIAAESDLAALSGQVVGRRDLARILSAFSKKPHESTITRITAEAYGRLSSTRRNQQKTLQEKENALVVATASLNEHAKAAKQSAASYEEVVSNLRQRIGELEEGVEHRNRRLENANATERELRKIEGNLRERLSAVEAGITHRDSQLEQLRGEQAQAIRQLAISAKHNDKQVDELKAALSDMSAKYEALISSFEQIDAKRTALEQQLAEAVQALSASEAERAAYATETIELRKTTEFLLHSNNALRDSTSWRVTAPLRKVGSMGRHVGEIPKMGLRSLNRASQVSHRKLKQSHPRLAEAIRRTIQPAMTRANMRVLGQMNVVAQPALPAPNPPGIGEGTYAFAFQKPRAFPPFQPLVSVIVPNYNHAPYLRQRLDSILSQSYDNFEVLLLDDCSKDESREILQEYADKYPDRVRTLFNDQNSGGVFFQWEKGISQAQGELIWIAESDDWASPNFLETLVPFFQNEAVQLAYCRTVFMDGDGEKQIWLL